MYTLKRLLSLYPWICFGPPTPPPFSLHKRILPHLERDGLVILKIKTESHVLGHYCTSKPCVSAHEIHPGLQIEQKQQFWKLCLEFWDLLDCRFQKARMCHRMLYHSTRNFKRPIAQGNPHKTQCKRTLAELQWTFTVCQSCSKKCRCLIWPLSLSLKIVITIPQVWKLRFIFLVTHQLQNSELSNLQFKYIYASSHAAFHRRKNYRAPRYLGTHLYTEMVAPESHRKTWARLTGLCHFQ